MKLLNLEFNLNRGQNYLKLFEIGKTFSKKNPRESLNLAALLYDNEKMKNWNSNQDLDFFHLKGIIEDLVVEFRLSDLSWKKTTNDLLHPYASAVIFQKSKSFFGSSVSYKRHDYQHKNKSKSGNKSL